MGRVVSVAVRWCQCEGGRAYLLRGNYCCPGCWDGHREWARRTNDISRAVYMPVRHSAYRSARLSPLSSIMATSGIVGYG